VKRLLTGLIAIVINGLATVTFGPKPALENAGRVGENRVTLRAAENGQTKGNARRFWTAKIQQLPGLFVAIALFTN
jgi:hypothetical protein